VILILLVGTVLVDSVRRWAYIFSERRRGVVNVPMAVTMRDTDVAHPVAEVAG
jgi:hypothetical protein